MNKVAQFLSGVTIGQPQVHDNMAVYPLHLQNGHQRAYDTLDEALAAKTLEVSEVSESGSVPNLKVHNHGKKPVLLVIGEELVGAKQNRVLNTSLLVPAESDLAIPVSCVERGRWSYRSRNFDSSVTTSHFSLRKAQTENVTTSLRAKTGFDADQRAVWKEVDRKITTTGSLSTTSALHDVYEQSETRLISYLNAFTPPEAQGMIVAVNGEVIGGDLFDHAETLRALWPKLLRGYALDAIDRTTGKENALTDTKEFITAVGTANDEIYESVGLGKDIRLSGGVVTGSGLLWEDKLVHASLFHAKA